MAALRIVAAALQEAVDEGIATGRPIGGRPQVVAGLRQPAEHQGGAGGGVQAHAIGQAAVAIGIVGQHQGHPPLLGGRQPQAGPGTGELGDPVQPFGVRFVAVQGRGQGVAGGTPLLEGPHPGGEAPIQFRQGHLQAEVERGQADAALGPGRAAATTAQHLQHRHPQPLPQGGPQTRLLKRHRSEARTAEHRLHPLPSQQIRHAPLHGPIPQAADPQGPWCKPTPAQGRQQRLHHRQIPRLPEGPVQDDPHPGAGLVAPVVGEGIGGGRRAGRLGMLTGQQGRQGLEQQT